MAKYGAKQRKHRRCYWCGQQMLWTRAARENGHPLSATRDHLIPRSHGGGSIPENIVTACRQCNNSRGSRMNWVPYHEHGGNLSVLPSHQVDSMPIVSVKR